MGVGGASSGPAAAAGRQAPQAARCLPSPIQAPPSAPDLGKRTRKALPSKLVYSMAGAVLDEAARAAGAAGAGAGGAVVAAPASAAAWAATPARRAILRSNVGEAAGRRLAQEAREAGGSQLALAHQPVQLRAPPDGLEDCRAAFPPARRLTGRLRGQDTREALLHGFCRDRGPAMLVQVRHNAVEWQGRRDWPSGGRPCAQAGLGCRVPTSDGHF